MARIGDGVALVIGGNGCNGAVPPRVIVILRHDCPAVAVQADDIALSIVHEIIGPQAVGPIDPLVVMLSHITYHWDD